jgi:galactokinase
MDIDYREYGEPAALRKSQTVVRELPASTITQQPQEWSEAETLEIIAPARVNLLGEHTDYTGGFVLPMAIQFVTRARISRCEHDQYRFRSELFEGERVMVRNDRSQKIGNWSDYPVGVLRELQEIGIEPPSFLLELSGNVPFGAGLSSSASVEVASCLAMLRLAGKSLSSAEVALLCQRAENNYVGSPCGIMDQFAISAGRKGHALMLNTRDLSFGLLPMNGGTLSGTCIVVCNSEVKHSVAAGEYGMRRMETEQAQAAICAAFADVRDLGDATLDNLNAVAEQISSKAYKRGRHIITENARVLMAKTAMLAGDAQTLGRLMLEGHASERDDFECSCSEVDYLVETAAKIRGCLGARLTGGGFGGCTVNLVMRDKAEQFADALIAAYRVEFGITAHAWVCEAVDGAMARNGFDMVVR